MTRSMFILASLFILLVGCSDDKSTEPTQPGTLYLNRLVVSMVPGGSETVTIHATNGDGSTSECTCSNSDPAVASATIDGSTLVVTGSSCGTTHLTISNGDGGSCSLPVQVYDPRVLDTGDLLISYTDQFQLIYSYAPPGWDPLNFYKPIPPPGFRALGTYAWSGTDNPNGRAAVMVVKEKPGSNAIALTSNFDTAGGILHTPIAPSGYKAMGQVFTLPLQTPDPAVCIREDLTTTGACYMFWSYENNFHQTESCWQIEQPFADSHESAYLAPGGMIYTTGLDDPGPGNALVNVLKVDLPMLAEAPAQDYIPSLTSYDEPPDGIAPRFEKAMLVPCTIVKDASHDMPWRIANSPFYRLERQVYFRVIDHADNRQGSEPLPVHYEVLYGMSVEQSQTVWSETGIELSAEAGLSIYAFEARVSATVSKRFGYESTTSITELLSHSITVDQSVPARKAGALWQRWNRYVLYRHNGTHLEPVRSWECGIESYVVDEYPD
jgi:hypothetical protein